ncbi:MAG TPA: arsenate reductase ArsC [Candidatus Kryptonia bacterium]|nr:arsenate reductase ArsC [Candidatus Kryptonia bacterium]
MSKTPRVLFLCTRNAARSQMAEALLRRLAGPRFEAASAGLQPTEVHRLTRQVLDEVGVDTSALRAKGIGEFLGKVKVDYAVIVCERAEDICPRVYPFTAHVMHWPFADPQRIAGSLETRIEAFREVRDAIDSRLRAWLHDVRS